jgi:hypothetical protein
MNIADLTDITVPAKAFTDIIMVVIKDVIDVTDVIVIADYSHTYSKVGSGTNTAGSRTLRQNLSVSDCFGYSR